MAQFIKSKGERGYLSPFLWLFLILGILLSVFAGDSYDGVFQGEVIGAISTGSFDEKTFFLQVLFSRLSYLVTIILLSTTSLGKLFLIMQPALLSLGVGVWIGVAVGEFGIKGVFLVLAGAFPHMLVYILILRFLLMLLWDRSYYDKQFFIAVFILFFIAIIGCILESYVNPVIVGKILEIY